MSAVYIKSLHFYGFAPIYAGTDLKELTIDMSNMKHNIIFIAGANGSAKSTIMSHLHPFAESNRDDFASMIIDDVKEGRKIIIYVKDQYEYEFKHLYIKSKDKRTIKSYITRTNMKTGQVKELNVNGNVTSFKTSVKEILDIDLDIIKVTNIGSDMADFINNGATERKKLLSLFLTGLERYNEPFKVIKERSALMKRDIKIVSDTIDTLDNEEKLKSTKKSIKKDYDRLVKSDNIAESKISEIKKAIREIDPDGSLLSVIDDVKKDYTSSKISYTKIKEDYSELEETDLSVLNENKYKCKNKINKLENKNQSMKTENGSLMERISAIEEQIEDTNSNIDKLTNTKYTIEDYIKYKSDVEEKLNSLKSNNISCIENVKDDQLSMSKLLAPVVTDILNSIDNFRSKFSIELIQQRESTSLEVLEETKDKYEELLIRKESLEDNINETLIKIAKYEESVKYKKILDKRPTTCKIDSCSFIKLGIQALKDEESLQTTSEHLEKMKKQLKKVKKNISELELFLECSHDYENIVNGIEKNLTVLKTFGLFKYFKKFVYCENLLYNIKDKIDLEKIQNSVIIRQEIIVYEQKLNKVQAKIDSIKNQESTLNMLQKNLKSLKKERKSILEHIEENNQLYSENIDKISKLLKKRRQIESDIQIVEDYNEIKKEYKEVKKMYLSVKDNINSLSELRSELKSYLEIHKENEELIPELEEKLYSVINDIKTLTDSIEKKERLEREYSNIKVLYDALSPQKGIPLIYIDTYLDIIKDNINELLEMAFGEGKFLINRFILDKEFCIEVIKNNSVIIKDIKKCSSGERSLASMAFAFALIKQSTKKSSILNILLLDEVDGMLDTKNRSKFIQILEKQIKEIGAAQVFIISHNREFDFYPADIILLKGHGLTQAELQNKNILFSL